MYPAALRKKTTQTVDSSQILAESIRQKQPRMMKSTTREWDKKLVKDLEQVCSKQDHDVFSKFWSSKTILSKLQRSV